ncbi:MAG: hypothetical protein KAR42_14900 [candidate division Zixibacteria bacterium]|nr:hypothetical protein [candidate division Zixibacteria bacterium]
MPAVKFNLSTQGEKQLLNAIQRLEGRIDKLEGKMKDVGKTGKKSFGGVGGELTKLTQQLIGPLGVAAAVGAVVAQLKSAYDLMVRNQGIAKDVQLSIAQARAGALMNLPSDFEGGAAGLDAMVARVAKQSGLARNRVFQAMNPALSARGSVGAKGFESSVTLASRIEALTGGQTAAGDVAGSLLDLTKATGMQDAMANLGFLRQAGAASRMTSLESQLNLIPGIAAGSARGITPEQSLETQAAISQLIVDPSGEKTRTGFINLTKDLFTKDLLPTVGVGRGGRRKTTFGPLEGTFPERITQLQTAFGGADEETQRAMEKQIGGRAGMSPFITNMLKNTELFQSTMAAAQRQVGAPGAGAAKQAEEFFSNVLAGAPGALLSADIRSKQGTEELFARNQNAALEGQARELFNKRLDAMGVTRWQGFTNVTTDIEASLQGTNFAEAAAGRVADARGYGYDWAQGAEADKLISELINLSVQIKANTAAAEAGKDGSNPNSQEVD